MITKYKYGICSGCQKEALIVHKSKKLCVHCLNKMRISKQKLRKQQRVVEGKEIDPARLSVFYQSYWNRYQERFCVECGIELRTFKRWHIHHLIAKKHWKDYDVDIVFDDDNCVYVCLECHSRAETKLDTTETIKKFTKAKQEKLEIHLRRTNKSN